MFQELRLSLTVVALPYCTAGHVPEVQTQFSRAQAAQFVIEQRAKATAKARAPTLVLGSWVGVRAFSAFPFF